MKPSSKKLILVGAVAVFVIAGIVGLLPTFTRARTTTASNACVNHLRQIEAAKAHWAQDNSQTTNDSPSWDAIRPYLGRDEVPRCPDGGRYVLGRVGELPRCSLGPSFIGGKLHALTE
jgi:hypothetical protein